MSRRPLHGRRHRRTQGSRRECTHQPHSTSLLPRSPHPHTRLIRTRPRWCKAPHRRREGRCSRRHNRLRGHTSHRCSRLDRYTPPPLRADRCPSHTDPPMCTGLRRRTGQHCPGSSSRPRGRNHRRYNRCRRRNRPAHRPGRCLPRNGHPRCKRCRRRSRPGSGHAGTCLQRRNSHRCTDWRHHNPEPRRGCTRHPGSGPRLYTGPRPNTPRRQR